MEDQKKVWNKIAEDWFNFKDNPNPKNIEFVKKAKGKILDLGCATGRHFTKTKATIYASDFSEEMIKFAKEKAKKLKIENIKFSVEESNNLDYEVNFFDNIICIAVLHCVTTKKDRQKTLEEIHRVLKPKGKLRISVWNKNSSRFKRKNKEDFVQWRDKGSRYYYFYDEDEFIKDLEKAGFKILDKFVGVNIEIIAEKV